MSKNFRFTCEQYFQLFEPNDNSLVENVVALYQSLAELSLHYSRIVNSPCPDDDFEVARLDWSDLVSIIAQNYKGLGYYPFAWFDEEWTVEKLNQTDVVIGDPIDDLADIYIDLREGYDLLLAGHEELALWTWAFQHHHHTAQHLHCLQRFLVNLLPVDP